MSPEVQGLVVHVLKNIVAGVAKMDDAPLSAMTHFDSAINALSNATDWRPNDKELKTIIEDAVEHMRFYGH